MTITNRKNFPRKFYLALLMIIIMSLLFHWNLTRHGVVLKRGGDTDSYEQAADNILKGKFYHERRTPLYPLFLAATRWGGDMTTLVIQRLFSMACPVIVFIAIYMIWRSTALAAVTALLTLMYYDNYVYLDYKLTEPLSQFLVTSWAGFLIICKKNRYVWMTLLATLLVACKSIFLPLLLVSIVIAILFRALPIRQGIIAIACMSIIPLTYGIQNYSLGKGFQYVDSKTCAFAGTQICAARYDWRIRAYPWKDPDIEVIRLMLAEAPMAERTGERGVVGKIFVPRLAEIKGIPKELACEIFAKVYPKIFFTSLFLAPHRHIKDLFYTLTASMDNVVIPAKEKLVSKLRRWLRYAIEYVMSAIFVVSLFACFVLFFFGWKSQDSYIRLPRVVLPTFLITFLIVIYIIAGPHRYRIPIHDALVMSTFLGVHDMFEWWKNLKIKA